MNFWDAIDKLFGKDEVIYTCDFHLTDINEKRVK
jgi:hypothetical protein